MSKIYISEEHGVNPSVQRCFWCGKDIGVVLFGKLPKHRAEKMFGKDFSRENLIRDNSGEVEAPRSVVLGLEPCGDDCEVWAHSKEGVFFVEADEVEGEPRPTGSFNCVRDEAVRRMLEPGDLLEQALKKRILLLHPEDFKSIFPPD